MNPNLFVISALWVALTFIVVGAFSAVCVGGIWSICGLSVALNVYLGWNRIGHDKMVRALGLSLDNKNQHGNP